MPNEGTALSLVPPVVAYAKHLLALHLLNSEGKGDDETAEALADEMDAIWHSMTPLEQVRMRGLAADLNVLQEGSPHKVITTEAEDQEWQKGVKELFPQIRISNPDKTLKLLRGPIPA